MTSANPDSLSTAEVAKLLDIHQATVLRIPRERLSYSSTPGGWRRYRREDVEQYAEEYLGRAVR